MFALTIAIIRVATSPTASLAATREAQRVFPVPEVIANLFQRKALRHEAAGAGMSKRVRPPAWDMDSEHTQTCADQTV